MILDKKGKLFGKVSIVDVIIVVIIVAAVAGLYYKFGKSGTVTPFTNQTSKVQITFYHEDLPNFILKSIKVGDVVKDRVQNVYFGKVTDIKPGPDIYFGLTADGQAVAGSKPGYSSVTITVEGDATYSATGATYSGVEYYVGKSVELRAGDTVMYPRISEIEKK